MSTPNIHDKDGFYQCDYCEGWIEMGSDFGPYETKDGEYICQKCHEGEQETAELLVKSKMEE